MFKQDKYTYDSTGKPISIINIVDEKIVGQTDYRYDKDIEYTRHIDLFDINCSYYKSNYKLAGIDITEKKDAYNRVTSIIKKSGTEIDVTIFDYDKDIKYQIVKREYINLSIKKLTIKDNILLLDCNNKDDKSNYCIKSYEYKDDLLYRYTSDTYLINLTHIFNFNIDCDDNSKIIKSIELLLNKIKRSECIVKLYKTYNL